MFSAIYPYLFLQFSNFVFLFSPSFSFSSRHEAHSTITMFDLISFPAGKHWSRGRPPPTSPGRPLKILFDRPGDVPIWRPGDVLKWRPGDVLIWRSRDVPGRLIRDVPRTFSGRPLEDLESTQTWMSKIFFNFSFRTYSIDQI